MSKKLNDKKRLPQVESSSKTFKLFAVSFHGLNLEAMEKELVKQMEVCSSKKMYAVMVNGAVGEQTKEEELKTANQIADGIQKCRKDFESVWESLTSSLSDDLRKYWNGETGLNDNEKNDSVETDESFEIIPKKLSEADLIVLNSEIAEMKECDFLVVVFGKFSNQTLVNLIRSNQPLQAIIHFIPCPESDLEVNFPELHTNIDYLEKSPDTKNVGIFIESLMMLPASEYFQEEKYSKQIYDQFTWYLYDIEMLTQQFIAYQADFVEINDIESLSQEELLWTKFVQVKPNKDTNDDTAVGVFLDNLCTTIGNHTNLEARNSFCRMSPFLENNYGKVIMEDGNELLRLAVSNQLDFATYWRLVGTIVNSAMDSICIKDNEIIIEPPKFYELLSWETFAQRLQNQKTLFDECCCFDITDKCKLYILRRTFNEVLRVQRKVQVPTKLCLRDFCRYLAPGLADYLRSCESKPTYFGLQWDDTLKEVTLSEQTFRGEECSICFSVEGLVNKHQTASIKIQLFGCSIYHHLEGSSRLRIVTENNLICNIEEEKSSNHQELSIQWPNGCLIRYSNTDNVEFLEQKYERKEFSEIKRIYTATGCVLRYLVNETIEILTPNGIIYTLYSHYTTCDDPEYLRLLVQDDVSDERAFVQSFQKYEINCEYFDVIKSDGRKLRVSNEDFATEIATFLVYEWTDYGANKKFLDREDGLKMVWSAETLKCYYPCGTVITTFVLEDFILTSFGCPNVMENIFQNFNPTLVSKGAKEATRHNTYITYHTNYLMQHKNYATVAVCGEDKMAIYTPDEFKLILKEDNVILIDIGEKHSFRIAAGVCTIHSGASISENKSFTLRLDLFHDAKEILSFKNANTFLILDANGKMKLIEEKEGFSPFQETLYFLSKDSEFGMEFLSKQKHKAFTSSIGDKTFFFKSPNKTVLLAPIFPIDKQFSMPIPGFEEDLEYFEAICNLKMKRKEPSHHVFSARLIHERRNNPQDDALVFVRDLEFTENTLSDHLNEALSSFFHKRVRPKHSPKWIDKLEQVGINLNTKKQRTRLYRQMLSENAFPNYFQFCDCNQNVKRLDLNTMSNLN